MEGAQCLRNETSKGHVKKILVVVQTLNTFTRASKCVYNCNCDGAQCIGLVALKSQSLPTGIGTHLCAAIRESGRFRTCPDSLSDLQPASTCLRFKWTGIKENKRFAPRLSRFKLIVFVYANEIKIGQLSGGSRRMEWHWMSKWTLELDLVVHRQMQLHRIDTERANCTSVA